MTKNMLLFMSNKELELELELANYLRTGICNHFVQSTECEITLLIVSQIEMRPIIIFFK